MPIRTARPLLNRVFSPFGGRLRLRLAPRQPADPSRLRPVSPAAVTDWLHVGADWSGVAASLRFPAWSGAVTPGERRALYALVAALRPARVLEVGTHLGGSTTALAAGLTGDGWLVTVDVRDVNAGPPPTPRDHLISAGLDHRVQFVTARSLDYLATAEPFDLVFLDGDHEAETVYREMALVTRVLRPGGVVVLHDHCDRPLTAAQEWVPGPAIAVARFRREHPTVAVVPLTPLPWPASEGTRDTTLAVIGRIP